MKISIERLKEIIKEELEAHALLEQPEEETQLPKTWKEQVRMAKNGKAIIRSGQGWFHLVYLLRFAADPHLKALLNPRSRKHRKNVAKIVYDMQKRHDDVPGYDDSPFGQGSRSKKRRHKAGTLVANRNYTWVLTHLEIRAGDKRKGYELPAAPEPETGSDKTGNLKQMLQDLLNDWRLAWDSKRVNAGQWRNAQKKINHALAMIDGPDPDTRYAKEALSSNPGAPPKEVGAKDMPRVLRLRTQIENAERMLEKGFENPPGSGTFNPVPDEMRKKIEKKLRILKKEYKAWAKD